METSWWEADSLLPLCGTPWALSLLFWQCLANIPSRGLLPCAPSPPPTRSCAPKGCRQLLPVTLLPCSPPLPRRHRTAIIVMIPDKALSGIAVINLNRQLIKKIKTNKPQARAHNLIQGY